IDARLTTMSGEGLAVVGGLGLDRLAARGWSPRAIGGLTLGADPIAYALALTARRRGQLLDAFTVRKQPKDHGTGQRIEGCFAAGYSVVVVEDVLTTGGSARDAINAVQRGGGHGLGVMALLDVVLVNVLVLWFGHGGVVAALFIAVLPYAFDQGQAVGDFLVLVASIAYLLASWAHGQLQPGGSGLDTTAFLETGVFIVVAM